MQVFVNKKEVQTEATTLAALIQELELPQVGVAAAIDQKMVARTLWEDTPLIEGAHITLVRAVCGG
ncbi:MAG: sulfur carrier protein ThiS [Rothia sp. (in: high G+C Gram-positive bacteria)]|uniref:sulfur carrier protein ThiS n=1 Tax=Rothia sp. (in: high G+C Gram-positive bacteria) TaxID=1885016 RepID=UPI0026DED055|nr:sulfur carrier protein ThiS [Rothia sp. (in: high G+C Gram-positive bacteria)]MDO5751384.1 sulfur carrier protein ThiS [Rothia sp. (in: high G+C Gram-positive bacteria)]